jgi:hypothetical protein
MKLNFFLLLELGKGLLYMRDLVGLRFVAHLHVHVEAWPHDGHQSKTSAWT